MRVYFISGLGADKTVFQLLDLSYCEPVFVDWITPLHNESLQHYALRISGAYNIPGDAFIVGLSFGGMLATEIAKAFPQTRVILLSSAKTKNEIPVIYKIGKYLPAYKWLPISMQKFFMLLIEKRFGIISGKGKEIYREVIRQADISFNTWAIWALLHWDNMAVPPNITHIHGTADKILNYRNIEGAVAFKGGGHLMVLENAREISIILRNITMHL